jgi:PAS domain S-box-containing protein
MIAAAEQSSEPSAAEGARPSEADRLAALARYQILDTAQERAFDRIVRLAALLLDVPIALISLVDADRQWFKARYGLDAPETPRAIAFCDHAIRGNDILVVPDARLDPRFCENPLVTGEMQIRFYAGAPLATPDGFALGTICAIDRTPRVLNARDAEILTALAEQVVHELEVRSALGELYREVAEGRRTARTLQGEGAKLEALLNATGTAVVTTDADRQVASLNRAAEAMFGFEPGESVGWPMTRLISTEVGIAAGEASSFAGEASNPSSVGDGWRKDGTEFPIEVSHASWTDAQGCKASGAILRDLTERRRAEAETRRREAAAQTWDKFAALGRTAGGVAHELNNLLQPIIGLTQLELDTLPVDGTPEQMETRESLAVILDSGKQARDVVRRILMFARKAKPVLAPIDFPTALQRSIASFGKALPQGVHVDYIIDTDAVGLATINEAELSEVMSNLASNAAYAMDGSGTLTIRVDRPVLTEAAASLGIAAGPTFRISVADTGYGMDADTKMQAFEPFFTTKPIGQGTGLGLSMAYGVLRDWKGAIAVDSTVGGGSTFTLYIPVTP